MVILGHSGFIGSHLREVFAKATEGIEVTGLSLSEVDLSDSACRTTLVEIFNKETAVILCAAVKRQFGDTIEAFQKNIAITENVAEAVAIQPVSRFAFMSSAAVYGEETHNTAIRESTPVNPTSYYGIAKFTTECLLRKKFTTPGSPSLVCFRPPLVYGPGDAGQTYGPSGFCAAIRECSPITLWGDGEELREFLFVKDLCRIMKHLTLSDFTGTVNLVSGRSHRFADILKLLTQLTSKQVIVNQRTRSKRKVDNAFDATLIRSLLPADFSFTPLDEGIRLTLN